MQAPPSDGSHAEEHEEVSLSEHENELREGIVEEPTYVAADWATSNLASVVRNAGQAGWAAGIEEQRGRAILMLSIRLLRAARAAMAVASVGWEVEARGVFRQVLEAHARLLEVTEDESDEAARRWLSGKPETSIGAAIRAAWPDIDSKEVGKLHRRLSQDAHADVGSIVRSLMTVDGELQGAVTWGPQRTEDTARSLLFCATVVAEAATRVAVEAGVEHPNREALNRRLESLRPVLVGSPPAAGA